MISFTQGNLLEAEAEALVNTVNTVGIMGKGIALMFKDHFPENFQAYEVACKRGEVEVGRMFVTQVDRLGGPRFIINFPTKKHWRHPSKMEWIDDGLADLKCVVASLGIRSLALPPLGSGNGGLQWSDVRARIEEALADLTGVEVIVYEPTRQYQNVAKAVGVEKLTPARALIAELVRRYSILGIDCSLVEIHKLAYMLERRIEALGLMNPLDLRFTPNRYGPYAARLSHLLEALDGSYLHCEKRLADAKAFEPVRFEDSKKDKISLFLTTPEAKVFRTALEETSSVIDGFESPLGMEVLATVDWLVTKGNADATVKGIRDRLAEWPGGQDSAERKLRLFDDRTIDLALQQLKSAGWLDRHAG